MLLKKNRKNPYGHFFRSKAYDLKKTAIWGPRKPKRNLPRLSTFRSSSRQGSATFLGCTHHKYDQVDRGWFGHIPQLFDWFPLSISEVGCVLASFACMVSLFLTTGPCLAVSSPYFFKTLLTNNTYAGFMFIFVARPVWIETNGACGFPGRLFRPGL